MIQKACCQQLSGTISQAIQTYSSSFKGREKGMKLKSDCETEWWRSAYFCVHANSRSPWQAMYLPERTMKDWRRKETFFHAKVSVHHGLSCLFKFCFLISKKPSTIWMWSGSLRAKKQNSASVPRDERPWGWAWEVILKHMSPPHMEWGPHAFTMCSKNSHYIHGLAWSMDLLTDILKIGDFLNFLDAG